MMRLSIKKLFFLIIALASAHFCYGRIPETIEELTARYGSPLDATKQDSAVFRHGGLQISATLDGNGRVLSLMYLKFVDGTISYFTEEEARVLVRENLGEVKISEEGDSLYILMSMDGKFSAIVERNNGPVSFHRETQREAAEAAEEIESAANAGDERAMEVMAAALQGTRNALMWELELAKRGNANYQYMIGRRYQKGEDVPKDAKMGADWIQKAADQGHLASRLILANCYATGNGVNKDTSRAIGLLREPANEGNALAQSMLAGLLYVQKDFPEAVVFFQKAAHQGLGEAQIRLAALYARGVGVPKNDVNAYMWALIAAANAVEGANDLVEGLESQMGAGQTAEGQRLAAEFKAKVDRDEESANISAYGSGFCISTNGHIITNAHVVINAKVLKVFLDGEATEAVLLKLDEVNDLALLKVNTKTQPLPLVSSGAIKMGDRVLSVGFPSPDTQGIAPKLATGEIASLTGGRDDPRCFQISVPVQAGNSGSPLVNDNGNVVGVVSMKANQLTSLAATGAVPENVNYAIKSSYVLSFLESIPDVYGQLLPPSETEAARDKLVESVKEASVLIEVKR